jgi:hypothetical protein
MNRISKLAQLAIAFLLDVTLFNPTASAQALAVGRISLPYEVEWLGTAIPAGQYTFSVEDNVPHFLTLRSVENHTRTLLLFQPAISYDYSSQNSVLNIVTIDGQRYVTSLALANMQRKFIYPIPKRKLHKPTDNIVSAHSIGVQ